MFGVTYNQPTSVPTKGFYISKWQLLRTDKKVLDWYPSEKDTQLEINRIDGELESKATQKDLDIANKKLTEHDTSIKHNAKSIELKANTSYVDNINKKVDKNSASIKLNSDNIILKAEKSQVDIINKTVKNQGSQINQNSEQIKLKAEKSYVDNKNSELDKKLSSQINVQSDKITANSKTIGEQGTKIGALELSSDKFSSEITEINNQSVGHVNLIKNSKGDDVTSLRGWTTDTTLEKTTYKGVDVIRVRTTSGDFISDKAIGAYTLYKFDVESGKNYEASFDFLGYFGVSMLNYCFLYYGDGTPSQMITFKKTGDGSNISRLHSDIFTVKNSGKASLLIAINSKPTISSKGFYMSKWQIVETDKSVKNWSESPIDNIEKLSKIEQTIDGIQETVKNKTDQSQTTQLAGQITTVIKDVNGNKTEILTTKNQIKELITSTDGRFVEVNKQLNGIQTTVKNKAEQTQVTTIAGQLTTVMKNVDGHEAKITANTKLINSKVSKGEVSSQINIESDNILIDTSGKLVLSAETIRIKGKSFLDAAVIKDLSVTSAKIANLSVTNAKIASLNVSKLTAGTINTGNIKIASTLEMTGENGTLNGHYDYDEPVGQAILPRRFVGSWQLGRRLMRFVGETYDSETGKKYYTNTYFGQDQVKMRKYRNGDPNDIVGRIDMSVYKESRIDVVNDYSQIESVRSMTSMTGKGLQGRIIGAMSLTTRAGFNGESDHLSKFLYIYPVNTWNPGKSSHAFRIRYHGENSVKLYEINSTFIYNATGGGAYDVKISSNGNLKSSRGTYNTSNLNTIQRSSQAKAIVGDKSLSKIVNLTPTSWKKKIENKDSKLANLKTLSNQIQVGYTIEDLQKAGLDNCLVINEDTGEADDYRVELVLPYLVEAIKSLSEEVTQLKENKLEEYTNGNRNHTGRLAAVS